MCLVTQPKDVMIYYLQHIAIEGPGTLGDFLREKGFTARTIALYNGEPLPKDFDEMQGVVILGGPMNVYEEKRYPFLKQEDVFIRELIRRDIPTLGLCLGAQLIAKAAGARVSRAPVKELGFRTLSLTEEGKKDVLFSGLADRELSFFQWHEDTFDVPAGGELLLKGSECCNQAFRLGRKIYGLQCHMEIGQATALEWANRYIIDPAGRQQMRNQIIKDFASNQERLCSVAERTYNNFLKLL